MWNFLPLDTFASVGEGEICDIYFQWGDSRSRRHYLSPLCYYLHPHHSNLSLIKICKSQKRSQNFVLEIALTYYSIGGKVDLLML